MKAILAAIVLTAAVSTGCAAGSTPTKPADGPRSAQSSTTAPTEALTTGAIAPVTKVLVFVEENHSLSQMKAGMPYAYGLAKRYGYASNYHAITHPSLPNYIAIAGGATYGIRDDKDPAHHKLSGKTVFGQAISAGKTAATYADGMSVTCAQTKGGTHYVPRHNPWAYFVKERISCNKYDVPLYKLPDAITAGTIPNVGMVIPNLYHDAHDGSLATADTWFKGWMTKIMAGPDWASGRLVVVLTADEDNRLSGNKVLTIVMNPRIKAKIVSSRFTHYSLTRLFEEATHTAYLGGAATAPSLRTGFGLG